MTTSQGTFLPPFTTQDEIDRAPRSLDLYLSGVEEICRRQGIEMIDPAIYPTGSTIVVALNNDHVLKLFPPEDIEHYSAELRFLDLLDGKLPVRTPGIVGSGKLEEWPYIIMDRLPGVPLKNAWPEIPDEQRIALCQDIGACTAVLHTHLGDNSEKEAWRKFIATQHANAVEQQRRRGLSEQWLAQIPEYLSTFDSSLPDDFRPVLLHTELMRDHILVVEQDGRWSLSGLIDFEPSMYGHPEYEFASVGTFVSRGEPALFRAFLRGYGYGDDIPRDFAQRIMKYSLLHRYSNLGWYLRELDPGEGVSRLEELGEMWFGSEENLAQRRKDAKGEG